MALSVPHSRFASFGPGWLSSIVRQLTHHTQMTTSKAERYGRLSGKAGIICSSFLVVSVLGFTSIWIVPDNSPEWLRRAVGVFAIGGYAAALVSGVICIMASIFSRKKSCNQMDDKHEDHAA